MSYVAAWLTMMRSKRNDEPLMGKKKDSSSIEELLVDVITVFTGITTVASIAYIIYEIANLGHTSIYIQDVYAPALDTNTTTNGTTPFNASVFVDLKFLRTGGTDSLDYADSEMSLFYGHRTTPVAAYRIRGFSMDSERMVIKTAAMEASELPWEEAFRRVFCGSTVELAVELEVRYRLQDCDLSNKCSWSKRRHNVLAADVAVDASGHMFPKGPIKLYKSLP